MKVRVGGAKIDNAVIPKIYPGDGNDTLVLHRSFYLEKKRVRQYATSFD